MASTLDGKVALVTGAASGIGKAQALAAAGNLIVPILLVLSFTLLHSHHTSI